MSRKIGISPLCYKPTLLLRGPKIFERLRQAAGADGLQILPFWFWRECDLRSIPANSILSYEGAWNDGCYWNTLTNIDRLIRDRGRNLFYDPLLFAGFLRIPDKRIRLFEELFPNALAIDVGQESARETQSDGDGSWHDTGPVVVDTFHLLEYCGGNPEYALRTLEKIKDRIVCIHFQFRHRPWTDGMLDDFLDGNGYLCDAMHIACVENSDAPIIVEISEQDLIKRNSNMSYLVKKIRELENV